MEIKIKDNAASLYAKKGCTVPRWYDTLCKIEGMTLEVETEYLFRDQFNTVPVPGVSNCGLRIMAESVECVIDDVRPGKMRCNYCGKCQNKQSFCNHCGKETYLENFDNALPKPPKKTKVSRVAVIVEGGIVQGIISETPLDVIVIDYDVDDETAWDVKPVFDTKAIFARHDSGVNLKDLNAIFEADKQTYTPDKPCPKDCQWRLLCNGPIDPSPKCPKGFVND